MFGFLSFFCSFGLLFNIRRAIPSTFILNESCFPEFGLPNMMGCEGVVTTRSNVLHTNHGEEAEPTGVPSEFVFWF